MKRMPHLPGRISSLTTLDRCADYKLDTSIISHFQIHKKTLERWHQRGLPKYVLGRKFHLYKESELMAWIDKHQIICKDYLDRQISKQ